MTQELPTSSEVLEAFRDNILPVLSGFYEAYAKLYDELARKEDLIEQLGDQIEAMREMLEDARDVMDAEWGTADAELDPHETLEKIHTFLASLEGIDEP